MGLMTNEKVLKKYRKNSIIYANRFDWNRIFQEVLE